MHIKDICRRSVVTCEPRLGVQGVAQLMRDQFVEDVVVVEHRGGVPVAVGLITFRDMVVRVVAAGVSLENTLACDVMTTALQTVHESELIYGAISRMRSMHVARLLVVGPQGALAGVLGAEDMADFLASELAEVVRISPMPASKVDRATGVQ